MGSGKETAAVFTSFVPLLNSYAVSLRGNLPLPVLHAQCARLYPKAWHKAKSRALK
jgi:hypothetical protein